MVIRTAGPIIRSGFPRAGSAIGDQKRDEFIAALLAIMGDPRLLWLPKGADTTTSTDDSRYAATITWDATVAARKSTLGSGLSQSFNGTANRGTIPDNDRYSFGDGTVDQAFSIVALANPTLGTTIRTLIAKYQNPYEWRFILNANETVNITLRDNSAAISVNQVTNAAITVGAWSLLGATYNGSRSSAGLAIYQNAALVASTAAADALYISMDNTSSIIEIGAETNDEFWADSIALIGLCAKELSIEDMWSIKALVNAFFDLAL